jgi:hypothetical protein
MSIETTLVYIILLLFFCLEYFLHYHFVNELRPDLNEKQKSYILSIKSSLSMLLIGIYYNYHYFTSKFNKADFFNILEKKGSLDFGKIIVLYFTAYLIMDIYIGSQDYATSMKSLSGYFHHTVYTIINMLSLNIGMFPMYLLHMLSELPTLLLSVGSFDSTLRDDNLFGLTFFITRIVYHIILTWMFRDNTVILSLSLATLGMHIYWFSGWIKKYFLTQKEDTPRANSKAKTQSKKQKQKAKVN